MKKIIFFFSLIVFMQMAGCKAPTVIQYNKRTLTKEEAKNYIEEMYYQGIWWRTCNNVQIDDFKIKATFSDVTTASTFSATSIFPSNGVATLFFKQIQNISFQYLTALQTMKYQVPEGKRYLITITTRDGNYIFNTTTKELSEDFINAIQYFRNLAKNDSAPIE